MKAFLIVLIYLLVVACQALAQTPRIVSPLTQADLDYYFEPFTRGLIFVRKAGSPSMFYLTGETSKRPSKPGEILQIPPYTPFRLIEKHSEITFLPLLPGELTSKGIQDGFLVERVFKGSPFEADNTVHVAFVTFNRNQPSQPEGHLVLLCLAHNEQELSKLEVQFMPFPEKTK